MVVELPIEIWSRILQHTDKKSISNCKLVCQDWNDIINSAHFWMERSRLQGLGNLLPSSRWRTYMNKQQENGVEWSFDYRKIVESGKGYRKVLVFDFESTNPWEICRTHGIKMSGFISQLVVEDAHSDEFPELYRCFSTSFRPIFVRSKIKLRDWGIQDWVMDLVRPKIRITQLISHRNDCASILRMSADLNRNPDFMSLEDNHEAKKIVRQWEQWSGDDWEQIEIVFEDYEPGQRYLHIETFGQDMQYWAGNFGSKFACLKVEVILPDEPFLHEGEVLDIIPPHEVQAEDRADSAVSGGGFFRSMFNSMYRLLPN